MKRTLFAVLFMTTLAIVLPALAVTSGESVTCQDVENSPREEYFESSTKKTLDPAYQEKLIRKAAALFLAIDTSKISMKRLERLAEDPATDVVEDPAGNVFALAQIGFGGGNSINYYFKFGTLDSLSVASYDGSCIERGTDAAFPIEIEPVFNGTAKLQCEVKDANSPVSEYSITVDTEDGNYTGGKVAMTAKLNPNFENLTTLAKAESLRRSMAPTHVHPTSGKTGVSSNVSFQFNNRIEGERIIHLSLTAREKKSASVWGKVFTNKPGGYGASDAYDFSYPANCTMAGTVTGHLYKRTVKY